MSRFSESLVSAWYQPKFNPLLSPLLPLSKLMVWQVKRRLNQYQKSRQGLWQPPVPVIVVGNIAVGGTGKTPLVAALVAALASRGFRPGIISRGYGAAIDTFPATVLSDDDPSLSGDEPVMLAEMTGVPVVIDPDRPAAARHLLSEHDCDVIISDDGLQHYALVRHVEIIVLDGVRWLGNGYCLPAGPLREPIDRIHSVDFVVSNGEPVCDAKTIAYDTMQLVPAHFVNVKTGEVIELSERAVLGTHIHAVAGIGHPQRFFDLLQTLGFEGVDYAFPDHYVYSADDFVFVDGLPVIMTSKDAIKCRDFARNDWWYLAVDATLPDSFWSRVSEKLSVFR